MIYEISIVLLIVITGYFLPNLFSFEKKDKTNVRLLWFYHLVFGVIFYYYVLAQGGSDSTLYWNNAKLINSSKAFEWLFTGRATQSLIALNYFPSNVMDLSYFTGNMIYCLLGYIGLLGFYKITVKYVKYNTLFLGIPLFPAIFYLPNLHYWTSNVGKDTLLFFVVGIFGYAILNLKKRGLLIILSLTLAFMVRPHIALFLLLGFAMAFLYGNKLPLYQKGIIFIVLIAGAIIVLPKVMKMSQIDELSVESYEQFSEEKASNLSRAHTGSSIDISSYPFPLKVFSFLFRPTIIDINSALSLIAAIENMILLILFIKAVKTKFILTFKQAPLVIKGLVFVLILGTIGFSSSLGNLGIMLRMRNMFLPGMIIYILWAFSFNISERLNQLENKNS